MSTNDWIPTPRLRWVPNSMPTDPPPTTATTGLLWEPRILEQWWGPDLPGYMKNTEEGEWRAVPLVEGTP